MSLPRRRLPLSLPMLGWLGLDVAGMAASAAGLLYLLHGLPLLGAWPASLAQAWLLLFGGLAAMLVGVANMLRALLAQADDAATGLE